MLRDYWFVIRSFIYSAKKTPSLFISQPRKLARVIGLCYCEDVQSISIKLVSVLTHMVAKFFITDTQSGGKGNGFEFQRSKVAR